MQNVDIARVLMADSLGFHIIFALLGVGLPFVMVLLEFFGLKRKDALLLEHAKKLSLAAVILVVAGAVSGTIVALQMSLVWGHLVQFGAAVLGLLFGWEGYAFIVEAVFLAFYMTSWGKIKGWAHWLIGVMVALGALGSAVAITMANAWMHDPGMLEINDGVVTTLNPLSYVMTMTAFYMTTHSIVSYYLTATLLILGVYAFYMLKSRPSGKKLQSVQAVMLRLSIVSLVLSTLVGLLGHFQTQYLAEQQPRKFAALESVESTGANQSYIFGGRWDKDGTIDGGIHIPGLLSFLAGNSINTEVVGLNDISPDEWPILVINELFDYKMLLVAVIMAVPLGYILLHNKLGKNKKITKPVLIALMTTGPAALVVVELGWMVAELGRQPYAVNGYLRTSEAMSASGSIGQWGLLFPISYVVLFVVTAVALWVTFRTDRPLFARKGIL